jgi:RNA polymerase sporulation-specific sigma factor
LSSIEHLKGDGAMESMVAAFLPYIRSRASRIRSIGLDGDDIIQEGLIGLLRAFDTYDSSKGVSFSTYAITCIDNGISTALRRASRKKDQPLNLSVELTDTQPAEALTHDPEAMAIRRAELEEIAGRIQKDLSKLERQVLSLYLEGYSYSAMAEMLHATEKAVDNALQRARRKLK